MTTFINTSGAFSAFVARQEADPRCGKLKLRDWLLTIVQRCPRYLLLLKDLMNCINVDDPEYAALMTVHALVFRSECYSERPFIRSLDSFIVTTTMNASLHSHAQTLDLLGLQRSTPNLPFQLIAPGRTFLKRGSLFQLEGGSFPRERDFLLFSDCLLWIANLDKGDSEAAERWDWKGVKSGLDFRPMIVRSRSSSEAEPSALRSRIQTGGSGNGLLPSSQPTSPTRPGPTLPSQNITSPSRMKKRQGSNASCDERWWFKGKAELVDLEIIVTPPTEVGEECRLEVWSPEGSFAVYAGESALRLLSLPSSDFCISS